MSTTGGAGRPTTDAARPVVRADAQVLIVACGATKTEHPAPAAQLYTGSLFRAAARAAAADGRPWLICSAQHGLVTPDQVLAPYQRTLADTAEDRARLGELLTAQQGILARAAGRAQPGVEAWAPARYIDALRAGGINVVCAPLAGLGIAAQIGWLTRHTRSCEAYHDATGQRPGPAAAANWLARDLGLVYAGSLDAHHGQPVVDAVPTRTVDDGSLLGFDYYDVTLANGVQLSDVRQTSLLPAEPAPGPALRIARTPGASADLPAPTQPGATRGRART